MTDSSTYFAIEYGILKIAIDLSDIDENFYDTRNGVLSAMCHEFTHLLQTIYSKIKTNDENNGRFVTSYSMDYGGSELLYYFCYAEMQARIAEIFSYNNKDLKSDDLYAKRSIWCMRYMINSLKNKENIYEYMSKLSTQAKYGNTMYLEKPDERRNDFPYLQNVTKDNYMKKYQILINDLEKRMKWYVSRVYYWLDKIKNENPSLLKRNDDFGRNMEVNIRTAKKISNTKRQRKKERNREYYINDFLLNPQSKVIKYGYTNWYNKYAIIENNGKKVKCVFYYDDNGKIKGVKIENFYIQDISEQLSKSIIERFGGQ
jgi:hypothetical protein